jgi:hypothetical protein
MQPINKVQMRHIKGFPKEQSKEAQEMIARLDKRKAAMFAGLAKEYVEYAEWKGSNLPIDKLFYELETAKRIKPS